MEVKWKQKSVSHCQGYCIFEESCSHISGKITPVRLMFNESRLEVISLIFVSAVKHFLALSECCSYHCLAILTLQTCKTCQTSLLPMLTREVDSSSMQVTSQRKKRFGSGSVCQ